MAYAQARKDFEYLEQQAELDDEVELDSMRLMLMQNPNKQTAEAMYDSAIRLWFGEHGQSYGEFSPIVRRRIRAIEKRYGI